MPGFQPPITIAQAIERITRNEYLLPAFQREYVWNAQQVENLFDSLMKKYPISSMLFWKVKDSAKSSYKFYQLLNYYIEYHHIHNDAFNTNQVNDFYCILDGQQRLTSLYLGLCGTYAYHKPRARWEYSENNFPTRNLYLNLSHTIDDVDSDKTYNFLFLDKKTTNEETIYTDTKGDHWFLVNKVLNTSLLEMMKLTRDGIITDNEFEILQRLYAAINFDCNINYYEEDTLNPDVAVNIFVRINSGGTKLSISDMLLSMCIAGWQSKDARTEIHNLVDAVNNKGFNITQDFVMKAFLYLFRNDVRFRIKSFDNKFIGKIEDKWEEIRDSILSLYDLMRSFGLNRSSLTSYNATMPILYYLYHTCKYPQFTSSIAFAEDRNNIRAWLLKTLILRSFTSHADTTLQATHRAFTNDIDVLPIDESISKFPAEKVIASIRQATVLTDEAIDNILSTQKDNSFAFAILSLLYPNLDYKNGNFHLDHIHPYALCSEAGLDVNVFNSILNLQMLDGNENMSKNAKPLCQWIDEQTTSETKVQFLNSHLIPNTDLNLENFENFIEERRQILRDKIKGLFIIPGNSETGENEINT